MKKLTDSGSFTTLARHEDSSRPTIMVDSSQTQAFKAKGRELTDDAKALDPPKETDNIAYLNGIGELRQSQQILAESQAFRSADTSVINAWNACDHNTYDLHECKNSLLSLHGWETLEDLALKDDALQYTLRSASKKERMAVYFSNRNYDHMKIKRFKEGTTTFDGEWTRAADGTEKFTATTDKGGELSYTENPDCSGEATSKKRSFTGEHVRTSFTWSSAKADIRYNEPVI